MFKKPKQGSKKSSIRRRNSDDNDDHNNNDDDDDEEEGLRHQSAIHKIKKKRKLLTDLQYKRGVDATQLLTQQRQENPHKDEDYKQQAAAADITVGNTATAATAKTPTDTTQEGILQQKHQQAMETFIQNKLKRDDTTDEKGNGTEETTTTTNKKVLTEEQLYQELAAKAEELAGRKKIGGDSDVNLAGDGVSGGGGVGNEDLTAGVSSGIEEVVLPVSNRLETTKQTLQEQYNKNPKNRNPGLLPTRTSNSNSAAPSSVPNRFAVPFSSQRQQQQQQQATMDENAQNKSNVASADEDRVGFDEARRRQQQQQGTATTNHNYNNNHHSSNSANNSNKKRQQRASDDRVYRQFVTRQREGR